MVGTAADEARRIAAVAGGEVGWGVAMLFDPEDLIRDFLQVASLAGYELDARDVEHEVLHAPHRPPSLPEGRQAVYVFSTAAPRAVVLKVGKVGPRSNARFLSQHYNPNSSRSNLAESLLRDQKMQERLGIPALDEDSVGDWLKANTARDHFYLEADKDKLLLNLFEAFLHGRLRPLFEG